MSKYTDAILQIVSAPGEHMTAEQIFFRLKETYPTVALATVYNNLNALLSSGRIRRISIENFPDRYDGVIPHDHLVCRRCGRLGDYSSARLSSLVAELAAELESSRGISVDGYDLKLFYLCEDCRKSQ